MSAIPSKNKAVSLPFLTAWSPLHRTQVPRCPDLAILLYTYIYTYIHMDTKHDHLTPCCACARGVISCNASAERHCPPRSLVQSTARPLKLDLKLPNELALHKISFALQRSAIAPNSTPHMSRKHVPRAFE